MADERDAVYDNTHRAFLQAFLARSTFTFREARPVLAAIFSAHDGRDTLTDEVRETDFNAYVSSINAAVSPFDLEIRSAVPQSSSQDAQERVFALVNTTSDPVTQLATTRNTEEVEFIRRILDAMFTKYNTPVREMLAINSMQAAHLARPARNSGINGDAETQEAEGARGAGITVRQSEKVLASMVDEGWFDKRGELYTLSPRGLMELRDWLLETYNEPADEENEAVERVKICKACGDIVTDGQRCERRECACRLHDHCVANFMRAQRSQQCPLCRSEWKGESYSGIRAAR